MTIEKTLNWAEDKLNKSGIDSVQLDAEVLLVFVLNTVEAQNLVPLHGVDKSFLYTHPEYELTDRQMKKFKAYIDRRQKGEPVAYIVGEKEFYGLKFYVNKNVLIPRPETEMLVDETKNKVQFPPQADQPRAETINKGEKPTIVDVGTGSGCIAIALTKNNPALKVYATDICMKALNVAKKNAKLHGVSDRITFLQGNLLEPIIHEQNNNGAIEQWNNFIITANLPYVPEGSLDLERPNTCGLKFEPKKALYAGPGGLDSYRDFFEQLGKLRYKPKYVVCEIGYNQLIEFKGIVEKHLPEATIEVKKDLAGLTRLATVIPNKFRLGLKNPAQHKLNNSDVSQINVPSMFYPA